MPRAPSRSLARADTRSMLDRLLDEPRLVEQVRALEPRVLTKLVEHVGLEDSGEIVALASTPQLLEVFDEDLWRADGPGVDETIDVERFLIWLEILLESGAGVVAARLAEMPEDLVGALLLEHLLVLDLDALALEVSSRGPFDVDLTEKALESNLSLELGQYGIIARHSGDGWDALVEVLVALDHEHGDLCERLLERLCHASTDQIEEAGGLFEVLSSAEMLANDAAAERQDRRGRKGFVEPSSARAFLRLAAKTPVVEIFDVAAEPDPITRAYFRELSTETKPAPVRRSRPLADLLRDAGMDEAGQAPLLATLREDDASQRARGALIAARVMDGASHAGRMSELVYLTNLVYEGCAKPTGRLCEGEAAEVALAVIGVGLGALEQPSGRTLADGLADHGVVACFRAGWRRLCEEVAEPERDGWSRVISALDLQQVTGDR